MSLYEIQYPDSKGNGCRLNCGVSFTHYHLEDNIKKIVPHEPVTQDEIVYAVLKSNWLEINQYLTHCLTLHEVNQKDFTHIVGKMLHKAIEQYKAVQK